MSDITRIEREDPKKISLDQEQDRVSITLPCTKEEFAEFVIGLLGKPQTLSKVISQPFSVSPQEVKSIHAAIAQRLADQNDGEIVQLRVTAWYNDKSKITFDSLVDFESYSELRKV